jgi:rhodanese-related sulfurtransferase
MSVDRHRSSRRIVHHGLAGALLVALIALSGCGSDDAAPSGSSTAAAAAPATLVSAQKAAELAADPGITVIDVRTPEEFAEGHLAGATMIDFQSPTFADDVAELDRAGRYLVYCRSGNRSGQAVEVMRQLGFGELYDMDGGIVAWTAAGLPLET